MLEDHDNLVDNLLMWARDSSNKLYFVERPDKFDVFMRPEVCTVNKIYQGVNRLFISLLLQDVSKVVSLNALYTIERHEI